MSLEAMVGRQLIVGLPGPDATDDDVRLLREIHAGGLMLYRRNFETPERFVRFIRRLEEGVGVAGEGGGLPIAAVDQQPVAPAARPLDLPGLGTRT